MQDSEKESAEKANAAIGYGPNNPEPAELRESNEPKDLDNDALHAVLEYINRTNC